ncbi:MAG: hypothetical protein WAM82_23520, partial [Thermoanaerobaculia bacterium]
ATPAVTAAAAPASTTGAAPGETFSCKGTMAAPPPSWCEPVRLLGDFLGRPPREKGEREKLASDLVQAARQQGYDLRFLVALVPAPPDPRLDQALEAIQRGFAQSEYLADRVWLPWTSEGANRLGGAAQVAPGLLLFRRTDAEGARSLALVLLVGETPKAGLQKAAFREALDLVADLQGAASDPTVALLGPSFSGSVESLRLSLLAWKEWEGEHQRRPSLAFTAATGSATAGGKDVEEPLANLGVPLCRTVLPDDNLRELTLGFLREKMGWDESRIALLVEADTAYGRSVLESEEAEHAETGQKKSAQKAKTQKAKTQEGSEEEPHAPLVMVPFPSHISELRTATEKEKAAQAKAQGAQPGAQLATRSDSTVLELDLTDPGQPADLVPTFTSDLTVPTNELVLENLLRGLSREGIRYVGILATDVKDKLFLAEQVRARVPDAVLFTFDNGLLYAHPNYAQTMDGLLVFSSAPLLGEGSPWQPVSLSPVAGRMRRQFGSELQQGIYEAVRYLLGAQAVRPRAWIMAVGNGSLWPVARLRVSLPDEPVHLCGDRPADAGSEESRQVEGNGFAGKDDLEILLVAVLLVAFAWRLSRAALLERVEGDHLEREAGTRMLLVAGTVLLALAAGLL